ncbi:MFS transporter [Steroidobacter sp.]|uniref:MFS transporter n=1 Tax=Steroidobacter sp. TaxID=1978227 RepID=UPI001A5A5CFE|nr:MFS transporter [Steroidobacter sp.]MBL8266416.1 MFS transporter [Steroidobacter sp.]
MAVTHAALLSTQDELLQSACRKNAWRMVVLLAVAYVVNHLDRNSIAYAGITMNVDLGLTASQFGWAAGLTIISYSLLEVPSNLIMARVGARLWLSRIMITWGIAASATALAIGPNSLYWLRLLLGAAEAGFFPGVLMYLSTWFPAQYRTRVLAWFLLGIPAASLIGGPLAGVLLEMNGFLGLSGWQWMFVIEGAPAVVLGVIAYRVLVDHPRDATWLTDGERGALLDALANERRDRPKHDFLSALKDIRVVFLTAIQFGFTLGAYGIGIWLPLILKGHGLSNLEVGLLSAPPYFAAGVGMLLWARYVDRGKNRVFHLTVSCLLAVAGLVGSVVFSDLMPSLLALTFALVGVSSARTIFWTLPPRFLVGSAAAGGIAFINSIGMLGGFAGPYMMGWMKDATGSFNAGLLTMGGVLLLTAICAASLRFVLREE